MTRVLVCGGRDFNDWELLDIYLSKYLKPEDTLIHGGGRGTDSLADLWFWNNNEQASIEKYSADWDKYGKGAGPIRNQQMLDEGNPDLVLAFPGGSGTLDMVTRARKAGVTVIECK